MATTYVQDYSTVTAAEIATLLNLSGLTVAEEALLEQAVTAAKSEADRYSGALAVVGGVSGSGSGSGAGSGSGGTPTGRVIKPTVEQWVRRTACRWWEQRVNGLQSESLSGAGSVTFGEIDYQGLPRCLPGI